MSEYTTYTVRDLKTGRLDILDILATSEDDARRLMLLHQWAFRNLPAEVELLECIGVEWTEEMDPTTDN